LDVPGEYGFMAPGVGLGEGERDDGKVDCGRGANPLDDAGQGGEVGGCPDGTLGDERGDGKVGCVDGAGEGATPGTVLGCANQPPGDAKAGCAVAVAAEAVGCDGSWTAGGAAERPGSPNRPVTEPVGGGAIVVRPAKGSLSGTEFLQPAAHKPIRMTAKEDFMGPIE
jgi:hypothetical protein